MTALANVDAFPAHLEQRGGSGDLVRDEYLATIRHAIAHHPRSLQKRIGPSGVGHPCSRRIGYTLLEVEPCNATRETPWLPTIGTAVHAWLEDVFIMANAGHDHTRWLAELRVDVGEIGGVPITGTMDLYDRVTATGIDHKIVGVTKLRKVKALISRLRTVTDLAERRRLNYEVLGEYLPQIHLYGRGLGRRGLPCDRVMIAFLPRNGELRDALIWHDTYDEQIALDALQRAEGVSLATRLLGVTALGQLPMVESYCTSCDYFKPGSTDPTTACPGVLPVRAPIDPQAPAFGVVTERKIA